MRSDVLRTFTFSRNSNLQCPHCRDQIHVTNMDQATKAVIRHVRKHAEDMQNVVMSYAFDPADDEDYNPVEAGDSDPAVYRGDS